MKIVCAVKNSQILVACCSVPDPCENGEQPGELRYFAVSALSGAERCGLGARELGSGRFVRE